jgi:hypothetical protein
MQRFNRAALVIAIGATVLCGMVSPAKAEKLKQWYTVLEGRFSVDADGCESFGYYFQQYTSVAYKYPVSFEGVGILYVQNSNQGRPELFLLLHGGEEVRLYYGQREDLLERAKALHGKRVRVAGSAAISQGWFIRVTHYLLEIEPTGIRWNTYALRLRGDCTDNVIIVRGVQDPIRIFQIQRRK